MREHLRNARTYSKLAIERSRQGEEAGDAQVAG